MDAMRCNQRTRTKHPMVLENTRGGQEWAPNLSELLALVGKRRRKDELDSRSSCTLPIEGCLSSGQLAASPPKASVMPLLDSCFCADPESRLSSSDYSSLCLV